MVGDVEVVVVVVRQDQALDRRQLFERDRRRMEAPRARPSSNGEARSPNTGSISQNLPLQLEQVRRVAQAHEVVGLRIQRRELRAVERRTGIGSVGTVPVLVSRRKRDQIFQLPAEGRASGFGGFSETAVLELGRSGIGALAGGAARAGGEQHASRQRQGGGRETAERSGHGRISGNGGGPRRRELNQCRAVVPASSAPA